MRFRAYRGATLLSSCAQHDGSGADCQIDQIGDGHRPREAGVFDQHDAREHGPQRGPDGVDAVDEPQMAVERGEIANHHRTQRRKGGPHQRRGQDK